MYRQAVDIDEAIRAAVSRCPETVASGGFPLLV
jgi:hypothetical protein